MSKSVEDNSESMNLNQINPEATTPHNGALTKDMSLGGASAANDPNRRISQRVIGKRKGDTGLYEDRSFVHLPHIF
jgi:hypothetical protein